MEYQKITNLLGNIPDKVPGFITKKWIKFMKFMINLVLQKIDINQSSNARMLSANNLPHEFLLTTRQTTN